TELSVEIEVRLAMVNAKPPLRALADVILSYSGDEIVLKRCAVFHKEGQPPWVSLPRLPIDSGAKKRFLPLVELSRALKQKVFIAVLDGYECKAPERTTTSSPGVSDQSASNLKGLRTGDGGREETPGVPIPGTGEKGPLRN